MHCPNCGAQAPRDQKFCRKCGLNLEKVPELLLGQLPEKYSDTPARLTKSGQLMERLATAGGICFISGGGMFFLFLLYNIVARQIIAKGQVVSGLALLLFFIGAALLLSYVIYIESQKNRASRKIEKTKPEVNGAETNKKLSPPGDVEIVASVTEKTTGLLETQTRQSVKAKRSDELQA
jgi:hypothetical protein